MNGTLRRVVQFVSAESQPGMIACQLVDADVKNLDEESSYPAPGLVRCEEMAVWQDASGELGKVTARRDGVESTQGLSELVVSREQVQ